MSEKYVSVSKYRKAKDALHEWHRLYTEQLEKNADLPNKIANLERDKILLEGRVQQLEDSCKDWKERYTELKQDYRDMQKWRDKKE
jgi:predicted nuclease with TOPRIM domain